MLKLYIWIKLNTSNSFLSFPSLEVHLTSIYLRYGIKNLSADIDHQKHVFLNTWLCPTWTNLGTFLQMIGSLKTVPPKIFLIVPLGDRHIFLI